MESLTSLGDVLSWSDLLGTDSQAQNLRLVFTQSQSGLNVLDMRHDEISLLCNRKRSPSLSLTDSASGGV